MSLPRPLIFARLDLPGDDFDYVLAADDQAGGVFRHSPEGVCYFLNLGLFSPVVATWDDSRARLVRRAGIHCVNGRPRSNPNDTIDDNLSHLRWKTAEAGGKDLLDTLPSPTEIFAKLALSRGQQSAGMKLPR